MSTMRNLPAADVSLGGRGGLCTGTSTSTGEPAPKALGVAGSLSSSVSECVSLGTSGTEAERTLNPSLTLEGEDSSVHGTLVLLGVFALVPSRQRAAAKDLEAAGVTAADLRDVAAWIGRAEKDEGQRCKFLAGLVVPAERMVEAVRGLREHEAAVSKRAAVTGGSDGPPHMVNMPIGSASCNCGQCVARRAAMPAPEPWDHDRMCRVAWCRVNGDKRSREEVAAELGVSVTTLGTMLDRGRALSAPLEPLAGRKLSDVRRDEEAAAAKLREFVAANRGRRLQLLERSASPIFGGAHDPKTYHRLCQAARYVGCWR